MERKRGRLQADQSPGVITETDGLDLPMPSEFQQTLWSSFTIAGIGLHTGQYACVRVRPAFAGEGRYFVRVPVGTNQERWDEPQQQAAAAVEAAAEAEEATREDPEYEQQLIMSYQAYRSAVLEEDFNGTFADWLSGNELGPVLQRLRTEGPPAMPLMNPELAVPRGADEPHVPAHASYVEDPNPITTILANGDLRIIGAEGLLSALEACGVDNARIEIEGGEEVPIVDGSADGWTREICHTGLRYAVRRPDLDIPGVSEEDDQPVGEPAADGEEEEEEEAASTSDSDAKDSASPRRAVPRLVLRPSKPLTVTRGSSFIQFVPEDTFRLTVGVDAHQQAPVIGKQWFSWCMFEDMHYKYSIADARCFVTCPEEAMALRDLGWLLGGTEGVMLIGYGERWYDEEMVRHEVDEPARHVMQDLIGDLSLNASGGHSGLPLGHIIAYKTDHELNAEFLAKLMEEAAPEDWVPVKAVAGSTEEVTSNDILRALGERVPGEDEEGEEGEAGEGEAGEGEEGAVQQYDAGEGEYDEGEGEYDEYDEGEYEQEEGVVDVDALPSDDEDAPRKGGRGGRR